MPDFPSGIPLLPDIILNDPPGSAAGGLGLRPLINRANDNILALIDECYNRSHKYPIVVNGGPIVWPEGVSFPAIANGTYFAESWKWFQANTGAIATITPSADGPPVSSSTELYPFASIYVDVTTADASLGGTEINAIQYMMEGYYFRRIANRQFTARFWVKSPKTGIHSVSFQNSGGDRLYVAEYTVLAANTWEEKSVTVAASPLAGTWDYASGVGLRITFVLSIGSAFQVPPNIWGTGGWGSINQTANIMDNTANDFKLYGLTIEPGPFAQPFVQIPLTLEDFLCKRYCEVMGGTANSVFGAGVVSTATTADFNVPMVPKRAVPSLSVVPGAGTLSVFTPAGFNVSSIASLTSGVDNLFIRATTPGGMTVAQGALLYAGNAEKLKISARLT